MLAVNLAASLYQLPVSRAVERRLCREYYAGHDPARAPARRRPHRREALQGGRGAAGPGLDPGRGRDGLDCRRCGASTYPHNCARPLLTVACCCKTSWSPSRSASWPKSTAAARLLAQPRPARGHAGLGRGRGLSRGRPAHEGHRGLALPLCARRGLRLQLADVRSRGRPDRRSRCAVRCVPVTCLS